MTLSFHPYANLFPFIEHGDLLDLAEDIRANGLHDRISLILVDGAWQILDGRNRYRALCWLASTGEVLGEAWGSWSGEALTADRISNSDDIGLYAPAPVENDGEALAFVLSKNLSRRHLDESQRAMVAARLKTLRPGRPSKDTPPIGGVSAELAAEKLNVGVRSVERAATVLREGAPELQKAVDAGEIKVSVAEKIARLPEEQQPAEIQKYLPSGSRAIMSARREPDDSLDYFPTPPWATRALIERVFRDGLPDIGVVADAEEPACGEGHIAEVLREYDMTVLASDIFDYGYGDVVADFLEKPDVEAHDWVITNPPFGDKTEAFVLKALARARVGVAMFVRLQWLEGVGRYERIYRDLPPTLVAFFAERVNLCKGRWDPEGSTATAYVWLVWLKGEKPRAPFWIAPGCREALSKPDDVERFTARPVKKGDCSKPDPEAVRQAFVAAREHQKVERLWEHPAVDGLHVISNTRDYPGGVSFNVATCQCGWSFRCETKPFDLDRDAACDAHWREVIAQHESGLAAELPASEAGAAAAVATDGASAAAAVDDRAPYDDADTIVIDQLAGSEWLAPAAPAPFDPASLPEVDALQILSDFCHVRRDIAPALGEFYVARGFAYRGAVEWSLTGKGWDRLRELQADQPQGPRAEMTAPRAQAESLFDFARQIDQAQSAEVVDGCLQTRLPVDDDELAEQLALVALDSGGSIDGEMARRLCGKDYLHATTTRLIITETGRAFLAQLVGLAAVSSEVRP